MSEDVNIPRPFLLLQIRGSETRARRLRVSARDRGERTTQENGGQGRSVQTFHQSKNDKIVFHIGTTTGVLSRNGKNFNFVIIIGLHASGRGWWGASSWSVRIVPYLMVPVSRQPNIDCMQFLLGSLHLSFAQECKERDSGSRSPGPLEASCGPHQSY